MELASNQKVKRLNDLAKSQFDDSSLKVERVPVQYDNGWKIA